MRGKRLERRYTVQRCKEVIAVKEKLVVRMYVTTARMQRVGLLG